MEHVIDQQHGDPMNRTSRIDRRRDDGQIIVLFALALVAIVGMVGLVLDGGSTYAQRRSQQSAVDLATIAAANQWLLTNNQTEATDRAALIATQNGFDPSAGSTLDVTWSANDTHVTGELTSPHRNTFAGVMGFSSWPVTVTATVEVGIPNGTTAGGPFIFNTDIFTDPGGVALPQYSDPNHPFTFGDGNGPIPNDPGDIAWTCYATCGNVDSSTVRSMVDGTSPVSTVLDPTLDFSELPYIGQYNSGNHSTLFGDVQDFLAGQEVAVPIVDDHGIFQGWATFHVTSTDQGNKTLTGYFVTPFNQNDALVVTGCTGTCPKSRFFGTYVLRLID
jgi:Flp pilus assembly protein TadG